jgi:hypothetical protein
MIEGIQSAEAVNGAVPSPGERPTVVYLGGSGRSGTTLLERALGELPGFVNVGELVDLFRRDAPRSERCGCGDPLGECQFWAPVGKQALDSWESGRLAEVQRLRGRVARRRYMPRLFMMPLNGRAHRADVASYGESYRSLYQAIAAEAGAPYVVDASKSPVHALALYRGGIDIRVVHLVRDVRGVAYSFSKRDISRPHALNEADVMWTMSPAKAAARWAFRQSQVELLRSCGMPVTRVLYEDFVREPRRTVEEILSWLALSLDPRHLEYLGSGRMTLGPSHGIAGNPSRFHSGEITLRVDEAWRGRMSRRNRMLVTAIGMPFLLRYGWRRGGNPPAGP